ncbi:MAG: hypothetical protein JKX76_01930 [Colwellia sp.]|nr:hypothetical protein [Colwellia sp.]
MKRTRNDSHDLEAPEKILIKSGLLPVGTNTVKLPDSLISETSKYTTIPEFSIDYFRNRGFDDSLSDAGVLWDNISKQKSIEVLEQILNLVKNTPCKTFREYFINKNREIAVLQKLIYCYHIMWAFDKEKIHRDSMVEVNFQIQRSRQSIIHKREKLRLNAPTKGKKSKYRLIL